MIDFKKLANDSIVRRPSDKPSLWPSELGGCIRKAMYRFHGYEQTHSRSVFENWKLSRFGWYEHAFDSIKVPGMEVKHQHEVGDGLWHGFIDTLLLDKDEGVVDIVDYKSMSPGQALKRLPSEHHKPQIWAYGRLLPDFIIRNYYLVYIDRWYDKSEKPPRIQTCLVNPHSSEIESITEEMEHFEHWAGIAGECEPGTAPLPDKPYESPEEHKWECLYHTWNDAWEIRCPWFGHCWPDHLDEDCNYQAQDDRHWADLDLPF